MLIIIHLNLNPIPHRLSCPNAGHWQALFSGKSSQKLPPAPDAMNGGTFTSSTTPHQTRANFTLINVSTNFLKPEILG